MPDTIYEEGELFADVAVITAELFFVCDLSAMCSTKGAMCPGLEYCVIRFLMFSPDILFFAVISVTDFVIRVGHIAPWWWMVPPPPFLYGLATFQICY